MSYKKGLEAMSLIRKQTQFNTTNQPSSESKKLGWERRKIDISIKDALLSELSKEVFDTGSGKVITGTENFAKELLEEWKKTKDPRYAKLIYDFTENNLSGISQINEPIQVIITTGLKS